MFYEIETIDKLEPVNRKLDIKTGDGKYSNSQKCRGCLTVSWSNKHTKTALAIGINPSKADDSRSDKTITTLSRFLCSYGYDEMYMFNIFEIYSTNQSGIDTNTTTDFSNYREFFDNADAIFVVWGTDDNTYTNEKKAITQFLRNYSSKIFCIKNKHNSFPVHPSRMGYDFTVIRCGINNNFLANENN